MTEEITPDNSNSTSQINNSLSSLKCHNCKIRKDDCLSCPQCRTNFCSECFKIYDKDIEELKKLLFWECPVCEQICNCPECALGDEKIVPISKKAKIGFGVSIHTTMDKFDKDLNHTNFLNAIDHSSDKSSLLSIAPSSPVRTPSPPPTIISTLPSHATLPTSEVRSQTTVARATNGVIDGEKKKARGKERGRKRKNVGASRHENRKKEIDQQAIPLFQPFIDRGYHNTNFISTIPNPENSSNYNNNNQNNIQHNNLIPDSLIRLSQLKLLTSSVSVAFSYLNKESNNASSAVTQASQLMSKTAKQLKEIKKQDQAMQELLQIAQQQQQEIIRLRSLLPQSDAIPNGHAEETEEVLVDSTVADTIDKPSDIISVHDK